jgi:hypothetical protein
VTLGFDRGQLGCLDDCTFDASGCVLFEECSGGVDEDGDLLIDCADADCAASDDCTAGETCDGDLADEDGDGLAECEDGECKAAGLCATGSGLTGAPCEENDDCAANLQDPFCLSEAVFIGWVLGYCSQHCDLDSDDCPPDAVCKDPTLQGIGICFDRCTLDEDCREGYECDTDTGDLVCLPEQ